MSTKDGDSNQTDIRQRLTERTLVREEFFQSKNIFVYLE
jgi:hypothetical protein